MKRLTRDWARSTVCVCKYTRHIVPHPPKISTTLHRGGFSCVRHLNRLTVYERMLGGFVFAGKCG
jgi:hypothetical protein